MLARSRRGCPLFDARSVPSVREHGKMARTPLAAFSTFRSSQKISVLRKGRSHRCRGNEYGVLFPMEDLDIHDGMARKSERASILKRRTELTLIGNREGRLPYEPMPWQMRADGGLWIDIPRSMLRFGVIFRLAIQVTEFDCQVVGILGITIGSIF